MISHTNHLPCPEITCYSVQETPEGTTVRYMIRRPGETIWTPVKVVRLTESEQKPPRRQPNVIEAALLGDRRNVAPRPPQDRTGPSVIQRIVDTIRKAQA